MTRIHLLSPGFAFPNSRGLIYPLVVHRHALADAGIEFRIFDKVDGPAAACDILVVDSKFHRDWWIGRADEVLEQFARFRATAGRIVYFDTTDSTGWIQTELLPLVDLYAKSQLLVDRTAYLRPMYGHRPHTDFYHRTAGVSDEEPEWSTPIADGAHLEKLAVGWNSALADWSFGGKYRMAAFQRLGWPWLLRSRIDTYRPDRPRPVDVSCRISADYRRVSVAYQRREVKRRLGRYVPTTRLGRAAYFRELESARIVASPFGYGEINYRDYESMISGAALLKPSMAHLDTWPALWSDGVTMLAHAWDLSDIDTVLQRALEDRSGTQSVAERAQALYARHLDPDSGAELFAARVRMLLDQVAR